MRILACLVVVGLLLGFAVPLPAFGILLVIITISYALVGGSDLSWAGRLYDLILASVALQFGYFLTILVRTLIVAKSMSHFDAQTMVTTAKASLISKRSTSRGARPARVRVFSMARAGGGLCVWLVGRRRARCLGGDS